MVSQDDVVDEASLIEDYEASLIEDCETSYQEERAAADEQVEQSLQAFLRSL